MAMKDSRQRPRQQPQQQQAVQIAGAAVGVLIAGKLLIRIFRAVLGANPSELKFIVNLEATQIVKLAEELISRSQRIHDSVASVPIQKVTYENVIAPLAKLEAEEFALIQSCKLPRLVSSSKEVRQASTDAEKMLDAHKLKCSMRVDVYLVVKALSNKKSILHPEAQRYIERLVRGYERKGLHLQAESREEAERLNARIGELCNVFQNNVNEDDNSLSFAVEELAGLHSNFIKSLDTGDAGRLKVTLKPLHYFPIMEHCKIRSTRSAIVAARYQRCMKENTPILEKVLELRQKLAHLLGYKNWAEYSLEFTMAKRPEKVNEFQEGMLQQITPIALKEMKLLQDLKEEEEGNSLVGLEDVLYYMQKAERRMFNFDANELSQYLPVDVVTSGIIKVYENLLGLKLEEKEKDAVWHEEVRKFLVSDSETRKVIGFIYLDLFAREGKYPHACVVPLQPGCDVGKGKRQLPVAALLMSLTKSGPNSSTLLKHSELVTYFHEFGHVVRIYWLSVVVVSITLVSYMGALAICVLQMHHICSFTSFARFSGLQVESDFLETPSHMLENWCYEKETLKVMSAPGKDSKTGITDGICNVLKEKRRSFPALRALRNNLFLGFFDQILHTQEKVNTELALKKLYPEVVLGMSMLEGTNLAASTLHLMSGGCDTQCYSFLWSEVFAADMFETKFKANLMNNIVGMEYRKKVLAPGATKDAIQILRDFLGRDPSVTAYLRMNGLNQVDD